MKRQNPNESSSSSGFDPKICKICKVKYESPEDIELQLGGSHSLCQYVLSSNDDNEKKLNSWAAKHFFYKRHMPKLEKIGWNASKKCEVHVGQSKKKKIVKLKKKKSSNKK